MIALSEIKKIDPIAYWVAIRSGFSKKICTKLGISMKIPGYWTLSRCKAEAKKYKATSEWVKNGYASYCAAQRNGWLVECSKHFITLRKPNGYWTLPLCKAEAKKYKTTKEWQKNSSSSYNAASRNGWLVECSKHFIILKRPIGYWTLPRCIKEAKKYKSGKEWEKNGGGSYGAARRNGWLVECSKHFILSTKPRGYWTLPRCIKEAKKYKTRNEWQKNCKGSYQAAYKNGWLVECCKHLPPSNKHNRYWTLPLCKAEAKKYKTRTEWEKNGGGSYNAASRNGWLVECCEHFIPVKKPNGYWTLPRCIKEAKKHKNVSDWRKNGEGSYLAAHRRGWLSQCKAYFKC